RERRSGREHWPFLDPDRLRPQRPPGLVRTSACAAGDGLLVLQYLRDDTGIGSSCLPALARPARRDPAFRQPARSTGFDYPFLSMGTRQQFAVNLFDPDTLFPRSGLSYER